MELTEQQKHLKELKEQQDAHINRHAKATAEVNECRDVIMKLQGAIDYLTQIGVTIEEEGEMPVDDVEIQHIQEDDHVAPAVSD